MNLTSLANVRAWLNISTDTDNGLLNRLIAEASRLVLNYLQRSDLGLTAITETISGQNTPKVQLRNWPITSVASLTINGIVIPQSASPNAFGWALEPVYGSIAGRPQMLGVVAAGGWPVSGYASGYGEVAYRQPNGYNRPFCQGVANIAVNYSYGYCTQAEAQTIPTSAPYNITPFGSYGSWSGDLGVTYANGTALTQIANGAPTAGQYVAPYLGGNTPIPYYIFAAADTGSAVLLNYNYVPYDLEQAAIEIVGERYKYRSRIGEASKTLGGQETASYMVKDALTAAIKARLDPYRLRWAG